MNIISSMNSAHKICACLVDIDRADLVDDSKLRRHNNTKSSINFGNNKIEYVSDMMDNQKRYESTYESMHESEPIHSKAQRSDYLSMTIIDPFHAFLTM